MFVCVCLCVCASEWEETVYVVRSKRGSGQWGGTMLGEVGSLGWGTRNEGLGCSREQPRGLNGPEMIRSNDDG